MNVVSNTMKRCFMIILIVAIRSVSFKLMVNNVKASVSSRLHSTAPERVETLFDFASTDIDIKKKSFESFERIDDAVMGGISKSSLREVVDKEYASWSGVCRIDGGGFCGFRSLPFENPLDLSLNSTGLFADCRLASDNEPDRRVWKLTLRTDAARGNEMLYQTCFKIPTSDVISDGEKDWVRVKVPFDRFQLVRGPRVCDDGPELDLSKGIFQIGMSLSKFEMGKNVTVLENFRPGYFNLEIQRMGIYYDNVTGENLTAAVSVPNTLSKEEVITKRPLIFKMLLPVLKLLFSEENTRRKAARKLLQKRKMNFVQMLKFAVNMRARKKSGNYLFASLETLCFVLLDSFRQVFLKFLRYFVFLPLFSTIRFFNVIKKKLA